MSLYLSANTLQLITWFLLAVSFILAAYILLLNPRHPSNRNVSALLLLFVVNLLSIGLQLSERRMSELGLILTAATVPALQPGLFLASVILIKPTWLRGRWRPLWWVVYGLVFLSIILTVVDVGLGSQLWYTPPDSETRVGEFLPLGDVANGTLGSFVRILNVYLMGLAPIVFLLYVVLLDRDISRPSRRLAWLLLGAQIAAVVLQFGLVDLLGSDVTALLTGISFVFAYAYAGFQQMISERRTQRGHLQPRLTALNLAITVPLLVAVVVIVSTQVRATLEQNSEEQLEMTSRALAHNVEVWLELNLQSLQQLVTLPDIISMDAGKQKPIVKALADASPHMYLVSTTDLNGINVARNDDVEPQDYSDRPWFLGVRDGAPLTLQTLVGPTGGEPALVASMPIRDQFGEVIGVGMFASDLTDIAAEVAVSRVGETGFAYVVDADNQVIAHPDPAFSSELKDLSDSPSLVALRSGTRGIVSYTEGGRRWRAYVDELDYGWGVVIQQPEPELLAGLQTLWVTAGVVTAGGILILVALTWLSIRQAIRPIGTLTDTAGAIAAGDLARTAPVESEDEIGDLARSFNTMTEQLRELIGSLEQQVADRTRDLEQRSAYLEATAQVGQAAASILEAERLIQQVVELIREHFNLYYVGLFLVDEAREWVVLRAGTGQAGQAMLARGHRIQVGEGMVGWSVQHAELRVASEIGEDAVRLATAELPDTRSEAALPLRSRGRVLGALTVQHTQPGVFDPNTVAVLQAMADQVAVTLDNARLFTESQEALEAARRAYGEMSRQAWADLLVRRGDWGYRYIQQEVVAATGNRRPEMLQAEQTGQTVQGNGAGEATLAIPLKVRDQVVGVLNFRKDAVGETQVTSRSAGWTDGERELLEAFASQLEVALESARLFQDTQRRAVQDRLVGEVTARMRETLDVDTVLRTAAQELRQALSLSSLTVQLAAPVDEPSAD